MTSIPRYLRCLVPIILSAILTSCASNGYISSVITTGIGMDVSENPQTQIPHVRFGYIRNGLYYIPTGKTGDPTGDPTKTPHVVSKIHVSSEFLKNISIVEKFAVGDNATNSESAKKLFGDTSTELNAAHPDTVHAITSASSGDAAAAQQEALNARIQAAEALKVIRAEKTKGDAENAALRKRMKELEDQQPQSVTFTELITQINKKAGNDAARNKAAFTSVLNDSGVKQSGVPTNLEADPNRINQFFQEQANDAQKKALITSATHQLQSM